MYKRQPLGPTGYGDSPYQSFSAFAGNPYFIDLDSLAEEGLLTEEECLSLIHIYTYHLLENVARWEKPEVEGVARKMDRTALKSDYCTSNAAKAFEDLVDNIQARYILLSYNNMAGKGNERSNAKITDQDILRILGKKGEVQVFSESYKAFSAGKSRISGNEERLFLCKCFEKKKEYIQSPMNYIGGKYKLLPQILPHFPSDMKVLVDLFCGGCNVGINADCKKVIFNDSNSRLIQLYREFKKRDKEEIFNYIEKTITHYCLSKSSEYGYDRYGCASSTGLGSYNKEKYLQLRSDFNSRQQDSPDYYLMMYVLLIYSFNNQLRFNQMCIRDRLYHMKQGLIVTTGNVKVRGVQEARTWKGLIIGAGNVEISGDVQIQAEREAYKDCLGLYGTEYFYNSQSKRENPLSLSLIHI